MRRIRLISCLAVAATIVAFAAVPASAATPTVSATPHRKLADGQTISVSASGFAANTEMAVVECPTATVSPGTCDLNDRHVHRHRRNRRVRQLPVRRVAHPE